MDDPCLICLMESSPPTSNVIEIVAANVLGECVECGADAVREALCARHRRRFERVLAKARAV